MKTFTLALFLLFYFQAFSQDVQIVVDEVHHTDVDETSPLFGMTSYRVFMTISPNIEDPSSSYYVSSLIGEDNSEDFETLEFNTTTSFYQHPSGSVTGSMINPAFFELAPELEWDSYITIGAIGGNHAGIPTWEDPSGMIESATNSVLTLEDPSATPSPFENFENGNNLSFNTTTGSAWFVLNNYDLTSAEYGVGSENYVYIGQFTTDGDISFCFTAQLIDTNNNNNSELFYLCSDNCTNPLACNYNPSAVIDDGSCVYEGDACPNTQFLNGEYILDANCECILVPSMGDLNSDGDISIEDLTELLNQFGSEGSDLSADLNGDGIVAVSDLTLMLSIVQN